MEGRETSFAKQTCPYGGWRRHCGKKCLFKHYDDDKEDTSVATYKAKLRHKLSSYSLPNHLTPVRMESVVGIRRTPPKGLNLDLETGNDEQSTFKKKEFTVEKKASMRRSLPMEKILNLNGVFGCKGDYLATGLRNPENNCYMNAVLQTLSNSYLISKMLCHDKMMEVHLDESNKVTITEELSFLSKVLRAGEYKYVSANDFKRVLDRMFPKFEGIRRQHDAHELLISLLDQLKVEAKERCPEAPIIYEGMYTSTIICPECQYVSKPKKDEFTTLDIDIVKSNSLVPTIQEGIKKLLEREKVE